MRALGPAPRAPISLSARRRHGALGRSRPACDGQSQRDEPRFGCPFSWLRAFSRLASETSIPAELALPMYRIASDTPYSRHKSASPRIPVASSSENLDRFVGVPSPGRTLIPRGGKTRCQVTAARVSARDGDWAAADRTSLADRATRFVRGKRLTQPRLDLGMRGITPATIRVGECRSTHGRHGLKCKSGSLGGAAECGGAREDSSRIQQIAAIYETRHWRSPIGCMTVF